jgi:hypothetical protein
MCLLETCQRKQHHATPESAQAHLDAMRSQRVPGFWRLAVYACFHCGGFHVGRGTPLRW